MTQFDPDFNYYYLFALICFQLGVVWKRYRNKLLVVKKKPAVLFGTVTTNCNWEIISMQQGCLTLTSLHVHVFISIYEE